MYYRPERLNYAILFCEKSRQGFGKSSPAATAPNDQRKFCPSGHSYASPAEQSAQLRQSMCPNPLAAIIATCCSPPNLPRVPACPHRQNSATVKNSFSNKTSSPHEILYYSPPRGIPTPRRTHHGPDFLEHELQFPRPAKQPCAHQRGVCQSHLGR